MHNLEDLLHQLDPLDGPGRRSGTAAESEQTWNVLVQILLPLVFVLTFVIITGIIAYKSAYEGMREFLDKDSPFAEVQLQEKVVELQYQHLLLALEKVGASRREELGIGLFADPGRVVRRGGEILDDRFAALCRRSDELLDDPFSPAFRHFADGIYADVLREAQLQDPAGTRVRRWSLEQTEGLEMLTRSESLTAEERVIVPQNRRRIHNHVLDFLGRLEAEVVELQVGVVRLLFEERLAAGADQEADGVTREALRQILDPAVPEARRRAAAEQLYRHLLGRWRSRLERQGYPLLGESWGVLVG